MHDEPDFRHCLACDQTLKKMSVTPCRACPIAHRPFTNEEVKENSIRGAEKALQYLEKHGEHFTRLQHAEKEMGLKLANGIVVIGRIDLSRRTDTNEIAIVVSRMLRRDVPG